MAEPAGATSSVDVVLADEEATVRCGAAVGALVRPGDVIALIGDLGVGKTTWMRGLASRLGVDPSAIRSPTFALVMEHARADDAGLLLHADLYRATAAELPQLGLFDAVGQPDVVAAIEWPEALLPQLRGLPLWTLRWRPADAADAGHEPGRRVEVAAPRDRATALATVLGDLVRSSRR